MKFVALALAAACLPFAAAAQSVSLAGQMGNKALLVIDGQTQMLSVGDSAHGVRLLQLLPEGAVVESGGVRSSLHVGGAPARLAGMGDTAGTARTIVIPASPGGHFITSGAIDGHAVRFMVDTGATLVAVGRADAERMGLDLSGARMGVTQTANGPVQVQVVVLPTVRVGSVEVNNVGAAVMSTSMPYVLLGNSFLARFQMRRDNDVMRLELR